MISFKLASIFNYLSAESVISTMSSSCANKSQLMISDMKKLSGYSKFNGFPEISTIFYQCLGFIEGFFNSLIIGRILFKLSNSYFNSLYAYHSLKSLGRVPHYAVYLVKFSSIAFRFSTDTSYQLSSLHLLIVSITSEYNEYNFFKLANSSAVFFN